MKKHKEETHGWTNQKSRCDFAGWWDCSFFCNKLSKKEKIVPCGFDVPDFERCKGTDYMKIKRRKNNLTPNNDFHLAPANLPADAVARQARPGFKAGNSGIDDFYDFRRKEHYARPIKTPEMQNPSTRLEDLVSYYNDIKAQENLAFIRVSCGSNESEMFKYLKEKRRDIDNRYKSILNKQDCYSFGGLDEVLAFLATAPFFSKTEAIKRITHEQQHANEAAARGYQIDSYQCWICLGKGNKFDYLLVTQMKTAKFPNEQDYRAITAAPEHQSVIDMLSVPIPEMKKEKIGYR